MSQTVLCTVVQIFTGYYFRFLGAVVSYCLESGHVEIGISIEFVNISRISRRMMECELFCFCWTVTVLESGGRTDLA